jgi:hypothetical protein
VLVLVLSGGGRASPVAVGNAIVLRSVGPPGFLVASPRHAHFGAAGVSNYAGSQCLGSDANGARNSTLVMSTASRSNKDELEQAVSAVVIKPSVAAVRRDFSVFRSPGILSCFAQEIQGIAQTASVTSGQQVTVSDVQTVDVPFKALGSDAAFAWRVSATVNDAGLSAGMYLAIREFALGRDEVMLETESLGEPFPPDTENRLASLLLARALAEPRL